MNPEMKTPNSFDRELLTPAGQSRRDSMRDQLQTEFIRFHHRRSRNRKAIAWSAVATAVLFAAGFIWIWPDRSTGNPSNEVATHPISTIDSPGLQIELVETATQKPGIVFELINDDQLLDMLAEAGHPSALAWIKGKPVVIPLDDGPTL